jgi:serine/threonine-protein kinase RsbW
LLELSLPAVPASCARARREVRAALHELRVDMWAVEVAVSEAVSNAVVHAYRDRVGQSADDRFEVRLTADLEGVWVVVVDDGVGMSARPDSPGLGLGLGVIGKLTDQLLIVQGETGTRVHMRFGLVADGAGGPRTVGRND